MEDINQKFALCPQPLDWTIHCTAILLKTSVLFNKALSIVKLVFYLFMYFLTNLNEPTSAAFSSPLSASDEVWGYVDVRDGAHMFWWLYYADSPAAAHQHLPLVMWLQVL